MLQGNLKVPSRSVRGFLYGVLKGLLDCWGPLRDPPRDPLRDLWRGVLGVRVLGSGSLRVKAFRKLKRLEDPFFLTGLRAVRMSIRFREQGSLEGSMVFCEGFKVWGFRAWIQQITTVYKGLISVHRTVGCFSWGNPKA